MTRIPLERWTSIFTHYLAIKLQLGSTTSPSLSPTNTTQSYLIPNLAMHMISEKPGWPGNPDWNPADIFNTTIKFDVSMPSLLTEGESRNVSCAGSWIHDVLPDQPISCAGGGGKEGEEVVFKMRPYYAPGSEGRKRRNDMSFELSVGRQIVGETGNVMTFMGSQNITANDYSVPTGFLMCVGGAPGTGLTCDIKGHFKDLIIEAEGYFLLDDSGQSSHI
ncbi:hypothetical protein NX059_008430 [Plenodomus lindquistii]|nr:hypothetical protein NX059_008430 [Plenodomus lindquistii]